MKECTVCSAKWDDNVAFCGNCGGALIVADNADTNVYEDDKTVAAGYGETPAFIPTPIETPVENTAQDTAVQTANPYAPVDDDKTVASSTVENSYMPENSANPQVDDNSYSPEGSDGNKPKKKKFLKPLIISLVAVVVVIGVVVAGLLTNWFGLCKPLQGVVDAFENTFKAESCEINVEMANKFDDTQVENFNIKYNIDKANEDITMLVNGGGNQACVYDSKSYSLDKEGKAEINDFDSKAVFEAIGKLEDESEDTDFGKIVKEAELEHVFDPDEIDAFVDELKSDYLEDKGWLEEYLGFEKDGDKYMFDIDFEKLCDELIRISDESDAITKDAKKDIEESLEELSAQAEKLEIGGKITITVKDDYIDNILCEVTVQEITVVEITLSFIGVNSTEISEDEINEIKTAVEKKLDDKCDTCGAKVVIEDLHGECEMCGAHGELTISSNYEKLCENCLISTDIDTYLNTLSDYCSNCGKDTAQYVLDGEPYCLDCYLAQ